MNITRLSKLQKKILLTIFENGSGGTYENVVWSKSQNIEEIKDLEKNGYVFRNVGKNPLTGKETDDVRYSRYFPDYKMWRSALAFKVFNWQKYNLYRADTYCARLRITTVTKLVNDKWIRVKEGYPPFYNKRQATLTRSLQLLAKNNLVALLHRFDDLVSVYSKTASQRLGVSPTNFEKMKEKGLEKYKQEFKKLQKEGHFKNNTFEDWFTRDRPIQIFGLQTGGWNSPESVYKNNCCHRIFRNISKIRLTPQGVVKVKELLKVKSRIPIPNLTFRHKPTSSEKCYATI
jgi:hypothetical protein